MSQQKSKKIVSNWIQCDQCSVLISSKDAEKHSQDCSPNIVNIHYPFVKNNVLYGTLGCKTNEEVKNLSSREIDSLVFLSQAVIQICSFSIGEWVIVKTVDGKFPAIAKIVWPTTEKHLFSVLLSKNGLNMSFGTDERFVEVSRVPLNLEVAQNIHLIIQNGPKQLELSSELCNRINKSYKNCIFMIGNTIEIMFYGKKIRFLIKFVELKSNADLNKSFEKMKIAEDYRDLFRVHETTKWKLYKDNESFQTDTCQQAKVTVIAGLDDEIHEIRKIMSVCLRNTVSTIRIRSVLLYGYSGTGKTTMAKMLAQESNAPITMLSMQDVNNKNSSVEKIIEGKFEEAMEQQPSVIIIDDIDVLCPLRSSRLSETEKRVVSTFLQMFDILNEKKAKVFVICTTNKIDNIDPIFRRYGRLDREIEIPTPSPKVRKAILKTILNQSHIQIEETELNEIAMITHGFVGADLVSLCSQVNLEAAVRSDPHITVQDFRNALKKVRPSAMREVLIEIPNVKWSDIGGQHNLKLVLKQSVEWPLKHPQSFKRLGISPPKGVLMFGPPGCSKTMIAKALATESGLNFLSIKGPELFSKWVGESERAVREVFRRARQVAPSIIFFDEIDALGGERSSGSSTSVQERVLAQLLTELDGVTPLNDVTIIAATNRPDRIDKALLRPGRLDRIVYVPLPDYDTRKDIFRIMFSKMPTFDINIDDLVKATDGYSGAEVSAVCHEAAMAALEENLDAQRVELRHFEKAMKLVTPRTSPSLIKLYEEYIQNKNLV